VAAEEEERFTAPPRPSGCGAGSSKRRPEAAFEIAPYLIAVFGNGTARLLMGSRIPHYYVMES
jgi:hypothetical protein